MTVEPDYEDITDYIIRSPRIYRPHLRVARTQVSHVLFGHVSPWKFRFVKPTWTSSINLLFMWFRDILRAGAGGPAMIQLRKVFSTVTISDFRSGFNQTASKQILVIWSGWEFEALCIRFSKIKRRIIIGLRDSPSSTSVVMVGSTSRRSLKF